MIFDHYHQRQPRLRARWRTMPLACSLLLVAMSGIAHAEDQTDHGSTRDVHAQVKAELYRLNPGWYNRQTDSWVDVVALEEDAERDSDDDQAHSSLFAGESTISLAAIIMLVVIVAVVGSLIALVIIGIQRPPEIAAGQKALRRPLGNTAHDDAALRAPRFMDLDLDEAQRADLLAALQQAIASDDQARMVVCAWAVRLVLLDRAGIIHLRPEATNRQLLRECRDHLAATEASDALCADLDMAAQSFEQVYFGARLPNAEALGQMIAIDQFRSTLRICSKRDGGAP